MKHLHTVFTNLLLALILAWVAGCGDQSASKTPPKESTTIAGVKATPLEESLTRWRAGDQAGTIQRFLEIDWNKSEPAFATNSPLGLREKDLLTMSAAERERRVGEAMVQLKDLKQLAAAVREKGTAAAATDPALARRCFVKLDECGAALDRPEALKILQLIAQAIRKMGAAAAAQPGK
jgi:hypothetical protein